MSQEESRGSVVNTKTLTAVITVLSILGALWTGSNGITAYLKNGGTIEKAAAMANHSSTRITQLCDRRSDAVTLDEVERVLI